jgi:uridine kinase
MQSQKPALVLGIAGGTGAGKTTMARRLAAAFPGAVAILEHDSYYRDRPDLADSERARVNYDHPASLDNDLLFQHVSRLREYHRIEKPVYDFVTHRRRPETVLVEPRPILIVEGILIFVDPRIRDLIDIKVFIDTDSDIRVFRRVRRDMELRGRSFESVREQYYATVRPMHLQFVEPSKRFADVIIPEGNEGNLDIALDLILSRVRQEMGLIVAYEEE